MTERQATALWVVGPGRAELRTEALPALGPGDVQVRAVWSGVSRGSESLVLRGGVPEALHDSMRAPFQAGAFPWPVKYGYVSVGLVEAGAMPGGAPVFCLFPHQDRYVVPAQSVVPLPTGLPLERAVLAANLETAVNGVWDAAVGPGDRVCVVGAGVVGALVAWLCAQIPGTEVELVDVVDRSELAARLGVRFAAPADAAGDRDRVFEASGAASGLATALGLAGVEAEVVALSWYGDAAVQVPLGAAFHSQRLVVRSSQVGRVPAARAPRWTLRRRLALALRLLANAPALDALLDSEGTFADLPGDLPRLADSSGRVLCHRVRYPGED